MNKSDYSLCLLVSSEPIWFMFILQALKNHVILEKNMIPLRSNVLVSCGFDFCLDLILPESTKKLNFAKIWGQLQFKVPSTRIHGQANAAHTRFQLSKGIRKSASFKRIHSRGRDSQFSCGRKKAGSCEGKNI